MIWMPKSKNSTLLTSDEGLTLTEFILVAFFFLFVIILVFQMLYFAQSSAIQANRFAAMTNEVGIPLDIMERYLSQNTKITSLSSQSIFMTVAQKDENGAVIDYYTVDIKANDDGTLTFKRNALGSETGSETFTLSDKNMNVKTSTDLFTFYTYTEESTEPTETTDPTKAVFVKVKIIAAVPESDETVSSERTVMFRNAD